MTSTEFQSATDEQAIAAFVAASEIRTNLARHSRGVDRNDRALFASAYAPDADVAYGMFNGPATDFATILIDAMAGGAVTLHRTSNMLVTVDGDSARSESYVIAYARTPDPSGPDRQRWIGGRYLDRHIRTDAGWRIAHRTYVLDWNVNRDNAEIIPLALTRGGQRDADPSNGLFTNPSSTDSKGDAPMSALDDALAKQALHDLVATYSRGVDRGDTALLASAFHEDADVITGVIDGKAPDFARAIVEAVRTGFRNCFHSIANEYYEVAGDRATGETYVIAYSATPGDHAEETLTGGRYLDRFEKRDGRWKIAHRTFVADWTTTAPISREAGGFYEGLDTHGGWSPDDPSVAFFAAA